MQRIFFSFWTSSHAPIALAPNTFPRSAFDTAQTLQPIFNVLVDRISRDRDFITSTLAQTAQTDDFIKKLLSLYEQIPINVIQTSMQLGIHRSDYMLQKQTDRLLQVEINTIASSFGCLSKKVGDLHRYLLLRNSNQPDVKRCLTVTAPDFAEDPSTASTAIPENPSTRLLVSTHDRIFIHS